MPELVKQLEKLQRQLKEETESKSWRSTWTEIRDNLLPDRGRYLDGDSSMDTNDGRKKRANILTATAERAVANLAAGLKSYLTTPSSPWFKLSMEDQEFNDDYNVNVWLDQVTDLLHRVFIKSNFYDALHNTYIEFAGFGTGCMLMLTDEINTLNCKALTAGEYQLATDSRGKVDVLVRKINMTVDNIVDEFGEDKLPDAIKSAKRNGQHTQRFWIRHAIVPADGRLDIKPPMLDNGFGDIEPARYIEVYYTDQGDEYGRQVLRIGGYLENPIIAPRWNVISNNVYGTECPGMVALGDIKMLYSMVNQELIATYKLVDPPVWSNNDAAVFNTLPGGVSNAVGAFGNQQSMGPLYQINPDLNAIDAMVEKTKREIETTFFNHLFLLVAQDESDRKTAFEVARIQEEKMSMLGPMIERINNMLDDAIDRALAISFRQGLVPEPPEELGDEELEIEYISLLAQAQKTSSLRSIDSLLAFTERAVAINPEIGRLWDWERSLNFYRTGSGAPTEVLKSPEVLEAEAAAAAQQQQQQEALAMGQAMAAGAKDLASAHLGEDTALDAVLAGGAENL